MKKILDKNLVNKVRYTYLYDNGKNNEINYNEQNYTKQVKYK